MTVPDARPNPGGDPLAATSAHLARLGIPRATLLVDVARARRNIAAFALRAADQGVRLRPHFKTHQAATVAGWFRTAGVTGAAVSSPGQAVYFADHGWDDLTLAIGANPRELPAYDDLAARIRLGLCADHPDTVAALAAGLRHPVDLWLEVDTGQGRSGVPVADHGRLLALARAVAAAPVLRWAGLLTHAGHTYHAGPDHAAQVFAATRSALRRARAALALAGLPGGAISVGDTPGCAAAPDWRGVDEVRPGNFVFFDLMQLTAGACEADDLACAVAAPVIGCYPDRGEVVLHAGAVHLSRDALGGPDGPVFGQLLSLGPHGFGDLVPGCPVKALSQEHATVRATDQHARRTLARLAPGDLLLVAPVHSCLACEQFGSYRTCGGETLTRYRRD
jgi:D-serine deaminase-like pyridoxal phosphate-dependent protein